MRSTVLARKLGASRLALTVFGLVARGALGQGVPIGGEIAVNTFTTGAQTAPQVGMADGGGFQVVWVSDGGQDGSGVGVFSRRFQSDGTPFAESQLNTFTTGDQTRAKLDMNGSGDWVAVWESTDQIAPGTLGDAFGRATTANGSILLSEAQLAPVGLQDSIRPAVSRAADDTFVVVWGDNAGNQLYARRFAANGSALTGALPLAVGEFPAVAALPGGEFVVAYEGVDANQEGILAAQYDAGGALLVAPWVVNVETTGHQVFPAVAATDTGEYLIAWHSFFTSQLSAVVRGRRVSAAGAPIGGEIHLSDTLGSTAARIDGVGRGAYVVGWNLASPGDETDVAVREVFRTGAPMAPAFLVNPTTNGQFTIDVAASTQALVAVWTQIDAGGDTEVRGQRYQRQAVFAEDFETADLTGWSATSP